MKKEKETRKWGA